MSSALMWDIRSVEWYFLTDVSGQPICSIFKGQAVLLKEWWTKKMEDGTKTSVRNYHSTLDKIPWKTGSYCVWCCVLLFSPFLYFFSFFSWIFLPSVFTLFLPPSFLFPSFIFRLSLCYSITQVARANLSPSSPDFSKSLWRTIQLERFLSKLFSFLLSVTSHDSSILDATQWFIGPYESLNMFRALLMPIIRSSRLYRWSQRMAPHLGYGRLLVWCMAVGFEASGRFKTFSRQIFVKGHITKFYRHFPVGAALLHASGRTDGRTWLSNKHFSRVCESA